MKLADADRAHLRRLLQQRQRALLQKVIETGGQVDSQEFESVERLAKLYGAVAPTPRAITVEVLIGASVVLCILSLLLLRLPEAGIELHAEASKVRFVLNNNTSLTGVLPVRWIAVQGHKQISVSSSGADNTFTTTDALVTAQLADANAAPMSLLIPELPAGGQVELSHWLDGTREIAFCDGDRPFSILIPSTTRVSGSSTVVVSAPPQARALVFPQAQDDSVRPQGSAPCQRSAMVRLRFASAKSGDLEFSRNLMVHHLELFDEPQPAGALFSTLVSGQFRVSSTKPNPTPLFPNDLLEMGSSSGRMRSIRMGDKNTTFDFQGTVKTLSIGSSTMRRSMMPSMLEWWLSQELVLVAWSVGLSSIGFLVGVYQWILKRR